MTYFNIPVHWFILYRSYVTLCIGCRVSCSRARIHHVALFAKSDSSPLSSEIIAESKLIAVAQPFINGFLQDIYFEMFDWVPRIAPIFRSFLMQTLYWVLRSSGLLFFNTDNMGKMTLKPYSKLDSFNNVFATL